MDLQEQGLLCFFDVINGGTQAILIQVDKLASGIEKVGGDIASDTGMDAAVAEGLSEDLQYFCVADADDRNIRSVPHFLHSFITGKLLDQPTFLPALGQIGKPRTFQRCTQLICHLALDGPVKKNNGLWSAEAEAYLLKNF